MTPLLFVAFSLALAADANIPDMRKGKLVAAPPVAAASATSYAWRDVAIGGGGFVTGLSTDARGRTRIVRTDVYGAYLWNEQKSRWTQLVTSSAMPAGDRRPMTFRGVYEAVVAPSEASRIYMAVAGSVYRSDDRGASFVKTALPQVSFDANSPFRHTGPFIAVAPKDPDLVLFGTPADGLWRSTNGGRAWSRVESVPVQSGAGARSPGGLIWFSPGGGEIWATAPGRGVYRSTDGGRTFSPLARKGEAQPLTLSRGAFAGDGVFYGVETEAKKAWKHQNGRWTDITGAPGLASVSFRSAAVDPRDGAIYLFDVGGRGFVSQDAGAHWKKLGGRAKVGGESEPSWLRVVDKGYFATGSVQFDPVKPGRIWNVAGTGPYFADLVEGSPRVEWNSQVRGIEELVANDVVAPPGGLPLFAGWDFGIHRRDDLTRFSSGYGPKERVLISAQQVDWSASNPAFLVTNASDTVKCCSQDGDSVLAGYSEDGGATWSKFASLPTPPGTESTDPWRMSYGAIAVAANDVDNIAWVPSGNRSPFYTKDRGRTWSRVELPGETLPLTGSHSSLFYVRRTIVADRVRPNTFYLYHSGEKQNAALMGLWVTEDGGAKWTRVFQGEIAPHSGGSAKLRAVPGVARDLYFTSNVGGAGSMLRRSVDGGRTWRALAEVTAVHDIAFGKAAPGRTYPTLYVTGYVRKSYGVWRSTDEGANWTRIGEFPLGTLDEVVVMDADKDVFGRVYLGFMGSGWRFGQPESCAAASYRAGDDRECYPLNDD